MARRSSAQRKDDLEHSNDILIDADRLERIVGGIGAILFASSRPIKLDKICRVTEASEDHALMALQLFGEKLGSLQIGVTLQEVADGWQLRTSGEFLDVMDRLYPERSKKLSRAAFETLAVIAYRQPVMRNEIESIRGVDSTNTLKTLIDAKLVAVIGREDSPGNPPLFSTTPYFLEKFGLKDLSQLPTEGELQDVLDEQVA